MPDVSFLMITILFNDKLTNGSDLALGVLPSGFLKLCGIRNSIISDYALKVTAGAVFRSVLDGVTATLTSAKKAKRAGLIRKKVGTGSSLLMMRHSPRGRLT
jgi:hypothetical protein